jgi:F-type H+-transporting ATPase subunit delta
MRDRKLATRYARALVDALPDATAQNQADEFLTALSEGVRSNAEMRGFLLDPGNPAAAKVSFLRGLAALKGTPGQIGSFLATIVAHGRIANLPSIAERFHEEREAAQGSITATLTASAPMNPELRARASAALEKLSGRKVNLKIELDPGLLGGAVARMGSMVYDGSLKTQLSRLRRTMREDG